MDILQPPPGGTVSGPGGKQKIMGKANGDPSNQMQSAKYSIAGLTASRPLATTPQHLSKPQPSFQQAQQFSSTQSQGHPSSPPPPPPIPGNILPACLIVILYCTVQLWVLLFVGVVVGYCELLLGWHSGDTYIYISMNQSIYLSINQSINQSIKTTGHQIIA
jgi:hypothetical protein